jgi:hypothetical protein
MIRTLPLYVIKLVFLFTVLSNIPECLSAQNYYIIVGAFSNSNNANKEAIRLKSDGFTKSGFLAPVNAKLFKVYVDSFKTSDSANAALQNYRPDFKGAWIYYAIAGQTISKKTTPPSSNEVELLKRQLDYYKKSLEKALAKLDGKENNNSTRYDKSVEEKTQGRTQRTYRDKESNNSSVFFNKFVKTKSSEDDFITFIKNKTQESTNTVKKDSKTNSTDFPEVDMSKKPTTSQDNLLSIDSKLIKIRKEQNIQNTRLNNTVDSLFKEISKAQVKQIEQLDNKIDTFFQKSSKVQNSQIAQLNKTIDSLSQENIKNRDRQITQNRTIDSLSQECSKGRFNFYNSKFSLDIGILRNQVFTDLTQPILDYFSIETQKSSSNFYGLQLAGYYHFSQKWSMGINMENYYYNNSLYLFPTLNVKFSTQIINSPIKLSPIIGGGINCILPMDSIKNSKFADYVKINGGVDIEMGIAKHFSFFATSYYNFCIPVNKGNDLKLINYYNFILGLRFNL